MHWMRSRRKTMSKLLLLLFTFESTSKIVEAMWDALDEEQKKNYE
jgi:hypothetical protein